MIVKDLETARVMVAKEVGTIFVATDECLANNSVMANCGYPRYVKLTKCVSDIDR